jgi:hypothetical protein
MLEDFVAVQVRLSCASGTFPPIKYLKGLFIFKFHGRYLDYP